jgi:hypothetical protein
MSKKPGTDQLWLRGRFVGKPATCQAKVPEKKPAFSGI